MRVKMSLFAAFVAFMIAASSGSAFAKFPEIDFSKFSFDRLKSKIFKDDTPVIVKKYVYKKTDGSINRDNDGWLVYIYGRFFSFGNAYDPLTNYSAYGVYLERLVYVYAEGGWFDAGVDIKIGKKKINIKDEKFQVNNYGVDNYNIPVEMIDDNILQRDFVKPSWVKLQYKSKIKTFIKKQFKVSKEVYLVNSKKLNKPQIGDIQIRYVKSDLGGYVTIFAKQSDKRVKFSAKRAMAVLEPYSLSSGDVFLIKRRKVSLNDLKRGAGVIN